MISTFARLKSRLLWNALRRGQGLGLILFTSLVGILSIAGVFNALAADVADLGIAMPLISLGLMVAAVFSPLLFGSTDETVDTTRLALFPLDTRHLALGMGTAALIGPGPIALLLPLLAVASRAPGPLTTLVAVLGAFTLVALVAVLPKLVMTIFGALLRRRRSRDLATVASSLVVAVLLLSVQGGLFFGGSIDRRHVEVASDVATVLPTGWPSLTLTRSLDGQIAWPVFFLGASWILLAYLLLTWARVLERSLSDVDDGGTASDLGGHLLDHGGDSPHPIRPVLAKEWRYLRRHPRYRVQVISQALVVFIGGAPFLGAVIDRRPEAVLFGCIPGLTAGLTGANLLGPDGRALWAEAIALPSLRPLLRGRSLVFAMIGVGGSLIVTFGAAAYTGGWRFAVPALSAAVGMAFTGAGIGSVTSTFAPVPYPEESNPNPFASGLSGGGCINGLVSFTGVIIGLVLAAPILYTIAQASDGSIPILALITVVAPAYGLAVWLVTTQQAGRLLERRLPDILTHLSRA
ncbi:MAG: hypothetical protein R2733_14065 [Acidimicrobiales bacterium]